MTRVCLDTETLPIRPLRSGPWPAVWRLGLDFLPNVGGVVPRMRGLFPAGVGRWLAREPRWVALAERVASLLGRPEAVARLGEGATVAARGCYVERAAPRPRDIFQQTIALHEPSARRSKPGVRG